MLLVLSFGPQLRGSSVWVCSVVDRVRSLATTYIDADFMTAIGPWSSKVILKLDTIAGHLLDGIFEVVGATSSGGACGFYDRSDVCHNYIRQLSRLRQRRPFLDGAGVKYKKTSMGEVFFVSIKGGRKPRGTCRGVQNSDQQRWC